MFKAELLELAFANIPPKKYVTDTIASAFDVDILRLPVKHCTVNPVELVWAQLKSHVRTTNVNFCLSDVEDSALDFIAAVDKDLAQSYIEHTYKIENIFKAADIIIENSIEPRFIESEEEEDSLATDDSESDVSK